MVSRVGDSIQLNDLGALHLSSISVYENIRCQVHCTFLNITRFRCFEQMMRVNRLLISGSVAFSPWCLT